MFGLIIIVLFLVCFGLWRVASGLGTGEPFGAVRHFHLVWVFTLIGCLSWLYGDLRGFPDPADHCARGSWGFDTEYRDAHQSEIDRVFPLSEPCTSEHDLVPPWVNVLIVISALAVGTGLVGLARAAVGWFVRINGRLSENRMAKSEMNESGDGRG